MNILKWLEDWYESNCDGDWEHQFGITIGTMDNPGWHLKLDLMYTLYQDISFTEVNIKRAEHDWILCRKIDTTIDCMGGPKNLVEIIETIKKWMEDNRPSQEIVDAHMKEIMECRQFSMTQGKTFLGTSNTAAHSDSPNP